MQDTIKKQYIFIASILFVGLPLLFWALGDFPRRTVLKESISIITIVAFFMMVAQLFLSRSNDTLVKIYPFKAILKVHKFIGYFFVVVFILHPIMIVVPRFFEAGVFPGESFLKLITTFNTTGQIIGLIAYILMFILGATSIFRDKLNMSYKTWKLFHGFLSVLFVGLATWHAIDMGRHTDNAMSLWMILLAFGGSMMVLNMYISKRKVSHER